MTARMTLAACVGIGVVMVSGPVWAQALSSDNTTRIEQDGLENSARIDQAGSSNTAGTDADPLLQQGVENGLTIRQTGESNQVGAGPEGLLQENTAPGLPGVNIAWIEQEGGGNRVDGVLQQIEGIVPGDGNRLLVLQNDGAGFGFNVIDRVQQILGAGLPGQSAEITMDGTGNRIELIQQDGLSNLRREENSIFASITGTGNGTQDLRGVAQVSGVQASTLVQTGGSEDTLSNGNIMQLEIQANGTAFGILQRGRGNLTGPIVIVGDGNAIGIDQDGTDNELSLGLIEGADNEIGLAQFGTNTAALSLLGESDRNSVRIDQMGSNDATVTVEGDDNVLLTDQGYLAGAGGTNNAELGVTGNDNRAELGQNGDGNTMVLLIEGDFNNNVAGGFTSAIVPSGALPGVYIQAGVLNSAVATVEGDANVSSWFQSGALNTILMTVTGDENEAYLRQIGNGNSAGLNQSGRGNVAVLLQ